MDAPAEKTLTREETHDLEVTIAQAVSRMAVIRDLALGVIGSSRADAESTAIAITDIAAIGAMSLDSLNQRINGMMCAFAGDAGDWLDKIEPWRIKEPAEQE